MSPRAPSVPSCNNKEPSRPRARRPGGRVAGAGPRECTGAGPRPEPGRPLSLRDGRRHQRPRRFSAESFAIPIFCQRCGRLARLDRTRVPAGATVQALRRRLRRSGVRLARGVNTERLHPRRRIPGQRGHAGVCLKGQARPTMGVDMKLTEQETAFVERRARLLRSWPIVGSICVVSVLGFTAWLWITRPLLVNPWMAMSRLETSAIPDSTATLLAAMLPVVFLSCIFVLLALIAFVFVAFSNERKHLAIIGRLGGYGAHSETKGEERPST